jgi:hypothetical protein
LLLGAAPAYRRTTNIGYPKLFTGGKASAAFPSPQPAVNNFVAARGELIVMANGLHIPVSVHRFSRLGRPGLLTTSRFNDYELIDRPVGRGLALNDYSRGRCCYPMTTLLYCRRRVKPAGKPKQQKIKL